MPSANNNDLAAAQAATAASSSNNTNNNNNSSKETIIVRPSTDADTASFAVKPETLLQLIDPKNPALYADMGLADGLARMLKTDLVHGLTVAKTDKDFRRAAFGNNTLPETELKSFWEFLWIAFNDKTLIVLCIAAAFKIAIGVYKAAFAPAGKRDFLGLIDAAAIIVAVLVVVLVDAVSNIRKQSQFRALSDFAKSLSEFRVVRNGETVQIATSDILTGDICLLQTGDVIPADGVLVQGFSVQADESTLTGEPISIEKDLVKDPFMLSGTKVVNGVGRMLVIATGVNSLNGRSLAALDVEAEATPLQQKLGKIADGIATFAIYGAVTIVAVLLTTYFVVTPPSTRDSFEISQDIISVFILAVAIVVMVVPEGLPLAVTLSLASATVKMLKDNNLVRHLSACETMGNATTICSDKTGTLTMNQMTVVQGVICQTAFEHKDIPAAFKDNVIASLSSASKDKSLAERLLAFIALTLNVNSTAEETIGTDGESVFRGSKTEVAVLNMTRLLGFDYQNDRHASELTAIEPFSSERKRMSCIVRSATTKDWICAKGASEIILGICDRYIDANGRVQPMTAEVRAQNEKTIDAFANNALRTIGIAIRPLPHDHHVHIEDKTDGDAGDRDLIPDGSHLVFVGLVGILDPLRPEVPDAVASCQKAGIVVRMVTGDNLATAKAIARGCGILSADGLAMEGPHFRTLTQDQMDEILPRLQVLARSSPLDKQILVNNLKRLGETVAVTGDGTNDAPALTAADVGFAMGIAGTEVAKEASDIVLMDDNFASLVKAVVWGRCVYDSIRKFLQFQLTVNVAAVAITIVTALYTTTNGPKTMVSVLSAVQLLWINLIINAFAALALATDPPGPGLLDRKPASRTQSIVSPKMVKMIVCQALFQIAVILTLFFNGSKWFGAPENDPTNSIKRTGADAVTAAIIFNTFVFLQVFNLVSSRSITDDINVVRNFFSNRLFIAIMAIMVVSQTIMIQFAGVVFKTDPAGLSAAHWGLCIALGFCSLPVGVVLRLLPDIPLPESWFQSAPAAPAVPRVSDVSVDADADARADAKIADAKVAVTAGDSSATLDPAAVSASAPSAASASAPPVRFTSFFGSIRAARADQSMRLLMDRNQIRRERAVQARASRHGHRNPFMSRSNAAAATAAAAAAAANPMGVPIQRVGTNASVRTQSTVDQ
ncbi:hypothetical protein BC831DRAFT_406409 [Entophlyctis helioformis]|nr:hypothetical protein BC831DRAFT_406409 [Entophlyctis helioformis]